MRPLASEELLSRITKIPQNIGDEQADLDKLTLVSGIPDYFQRFPRFIQSYITITRPGDDVVN